MLTQLLCSLCLILMSALGISLFLLIYCIIHCGEEDEPQNKNVCADISSRMNSLYPEMESRK